MLWENCDLMRKKYDACIYPIWIFKSVLKDFDKVPQTSQKLLDPFEHCSKGHYSFSDFSWFLIVVSNFDIALLEIPIIEKKITINLLYLISKNHYIKKNLNSIEIKLEKII